MDVTPQLLKDVEFREKKFGGYDPDEVDDFLERVGVAIGHLQARLRDATQRAEAAESRVAQMESQPPVAAETDETLRRTLLLAQRTADAAVQEANEEASRTIAEAEERAERLIAEAQEQHDRQVAEAEEDVRRTIDETRERLLQEINALEEIRDQLMSDVETLERHVEDERSRLQTALGTLQALVDDSGALGQIESPEISGVTPPAEPAPDFSAPAPAVVPEVGAPPAAEPQAPIFSEPVGAEAPAVAAFPEPEPELAPELEPEPEPEPVAEAPPPSFEPEPSPAFEEPEVTEQPAPAPVADLWSDEPAPSTEPAPSPQPSPGASVWDTPGESFPSEPVEPANDPFAPAENDAPVIRAPGLRQDDFGEASPAEAEVFPQPPPPPPRPEKPSGFGGLGGPAAGPAHDPWADMAPRTDSMPAIGEDPGGDNPWMADLQREEQANQPAPAADDDAMAEWYRQGEPEDEERQEKGRRFGRKK